MINKVKKLTVKYNDKLIGYLAELDGSEIAFQYDEQWIENGFSISPFSLPLSNQIYICKKDTFGGIYGVFNDSLPDGWGALLTERMFAKSGINYSRLSPLTKLTLISKNGLGALTYVPTQYEDLDISEYNLDEIAEDAKRVLDDIDIMDTDFDKIVQFGGSSGGARPKVHIKFQNEYWIVKFPCRIDPADIGKEEFIANYSAEKCGINVNSYKLFKSELCSGYFGAKRFDRIGEEKVHIISLAALLETTHRIPNLDYIHLFQVIENICTVKDDLYEAYKRMCFNILYGNKDDHSKNFSFLYDDNICGYRLSPAYDLTKTPYKTEHEMTVNGIGNPDENDLLEVAKKMHLSLAKCQKIIIDIKQILKNDNKNKNFLLGR